MNQVSLTTVSELSKQRELSLLIKQSNTTATHSSTLNQVGQRTLIWSDDTNGSLNSFLHQQINISIQTNDSEGEQADFGWTSNIQSNNPVPFKILTADTNPTYRLEDGKFEVILNDQSTVNLNVKNFSVNREDKGCFPSSGTITGTFSDENPIEFAITFGIEGLPVFELSDGSQLNFAAQGCSLREQ